MQVDMEVKALYEGQISVSYVSPQTVITLSWSKKSTYYNSYYQD